MINPEIRKKTIENIINAGLELYYYIELVGPEKAISNNSFGTICPNAIKISSQVLEKIFAENR